MLAADPDIAGTADWIGRWFGRFVRDLGCFDCVGEQTVEGRIVEAQQVKIEVFFLQRRQFRCQHLIVPATVGSNLVVGDHQGAALGRAEVGQDDHWRLIQS